MWNTITNTINQFVWYKELILFFTEQNLLEDGTLSSIYPPKDGISLFNDWDDVVPTLIALGYYPQIINWHKKAGQYLYDGLPTSPDNKIYSWRIDEYIAGLQVTLDYKHDDTTEVLLENALTGIHNLLLQNNKLQGCHIIDKNITLPTMFARSGSTLEILIETRLRNVAYDILMSWINNPYFQKFGVFPNYWSPTPTWLYETALSSFFPDKLRGYNDTSNFMQQSNLLRYRPNMISKLMKDNSNLLFGLIAAYRFKPNAHLKGSIIRWITTSKSYFIKNNFVKEMWSPTRNYCQIILSQNFTFIDILCEIFYYVDSDEKLIDLACEIAQQWLGIKLQTGTIPTSPDQSISILDEQTDFIVSLCKISELTNDKEWKKYAKQILKSTIEHFRSNDGLITSIDGTGNVVNGTIATKYNFLFAKALFAVNTSESIFDNDIYHNFLQDR